MTAARKSSSPKPARKSATRRRLKPAAPKPAMPEPPEPPAPPPADAGAPKPATPIAAQVHDMVERELRAVERVLAALEPADAGEAERTARTLASLARALRELSLVTPVHDAPVHDAAEAETTDNDDAVPRDLDEFRRELARRINAFVDIRADDGVRDDPDGGVEHKPLA